MPLKPAAVTLAGKVLTLRPLNLERDLEALWTCSNGQPFALGGRRTEAYDADALVWRLMSAGPFANAAAMRPYLAASIEGAAILALCAVDNASGQAVGVTTLMNNVPEHLKIELGNIWYSPVMQGTAANTEATYLLLRHVFALGYRRVEWKCNALNERSRWAAARMGFQFEGIQESHYISKGRNRDSAWYRILDREWPSVQAHLEALLGRDG